MANITPLCICTSRPPLHDRDDCPALLDGLERELARRGITWSEEAQSFVQTPDPADTGA